jgi:hypothetical protein
MRRGSWSRAPGLLNVGASYIEEMLQTYLLLCGSAFLAGAVNSIAGGGTLLTFPALMAVVSPVEAKQ